MSHILGIAAWVIAVAGTITTLALLSAPLFRQRVMVLRLRKDLRGVETTVVTWSREHGPHS